MLAVSDQAAEAIGNILSSRELPDEAGVRISADIGASAGGDPQSALRMEVVAAPESSDQVLEDAPVFLEPEAAAMLDDKLLDADVTGEEVRFDLKEQSQ